MVSQHTSTETRVDQNQLVRGSMLGGVLLAMFGIVALFAPFVIGLSLAVVLGALLVVGGLVHVAAAFSAGSLLGIGWQVFLGLVYGVAGIAVLVNPLLGLTTLTLLVIGFFLVSGLVQLGWAVTGGEGSRTWLAVSGVLGLLLAILLWVDFPASALWAVGVLFGVNFLVTGVSMILHSRKRRPAAAVGTPGEAGGQRM